MKKNKIFAFCGVHGDEQNAVKTVYKLQNLFVDTCVVNLEALRKNTRCIDGYDLNRHASENENAKNFVDNYNVYGDNTIVVDVHNSPNLYNCVVIDNNKFALSYIEFCVKNDIPYCIVEQKDTFKAFCIHNKIPAFTVELNGMGFVDKKIEDENQKFLEDLVHKLENVKNLKSFFTNENVYTRIEHSDLMYTKKYIEQYDNDIHLREYSRTIPYGFYKKGELIVTVNNEYFFAEEDGWVIDIENSIFAVNECALYEFQNIIDLSKYR